MTVGHVDCFIQKSEPVTAHFDLGHAAYGSGGWEMNSKWQKCNECTAREMENSLMEASTAEQKAGVKYDQEGKKNMSK